MLGVQECSYRKKKKEKINFGWKPVSQMKI